MKGDFSRIRHNLNKHYTAVLQQQGRVALDADSNEQQAIDDHIRDTEITDIVGPFGGPKGDAGFKITVPDANTIMIGRGRYYVDGILCESDASQDYDAQTYLVNPGVTDADLLDELTGGSAYALRLYLEVWQRLVTVLDDPCLREPALGQADTTARLQTVWRVVAEPVTAAGTPVAGTIAQPLAANSIAVTAKPGACCTEMYRPVKSAKSGKLWARTTPGSSDCTCEPTPQAGYRGLENQLYRVEIHKGGDGQKATFKWSRENGSVVAAVTGVSSNTINVSSLGPDANLGFLANNWVELTDDSNLFGPIPNQPGALIQIQNPVADSLALVLQQPAVGIDPSINARVRRWDQFGNSAGSDGIQLDVDTWIDLENGIQVRFSPGNYESGDYWLIPARTATGQIEWPPCGGDGNNYQPPYSTTIYRAPLACIHWDAQTQTFPVEDCRRIFPPLTEQESATCCTFHVGDGVNSVGDYTSINEAIKHLPAEGGEICVLAGLYYENVVISGRVDVGIYGCGPETRIVSPSLQPGATVAANNKPVLTVLNSQHIELDSFVVEADQGSIGILLDQFSARELVGARDVVLQKITAQATKDVEMQNLIVTASNQPAIYVNKSTSVKIERCKIAMANVDSKYPAVYLSGSEINMWDNWVGLAAAALLPKVVQTDLAPATTTPANVIVQFNPNIIKDLDQVLLEKKPTAAAMQPTGTGGIQVGGISTDIYILRNEIQGGRGNGITLGSLVIVDPKGNIVGNPVGVIPPGQSTGECCTQSLLFPVYTTYDNTETQGRIVLEGRLTNVHIENNRIRDMGLCGIGPVGFFNLTDNPEVVSTNGLFIVENEITRCPSRAITELTQDQSAFMGYGAISLGDVSGLVVRDNQITDTGETLKDPVCGIFVLHGEQIEISRNQIVDLRDWSTADVKSFSGFRAGICVAMVTPPAATSGLAAYLENFTTYDPGIVQERSVYLGDVPALCVQENVVKVPIGLALSVMGLGAFSIQANQFATGGAVSNKGLVIAGSVMVLNFGTPVEAPRPVTRAADIMGVLLAGNAEGISFATALAAAKTNSIVGSVAPGPVLFSQNRCSLQLDVNKTRVLASVFIATADDLGFHDNQCWLKSAVVKDDYAYGKIQVVCDVLLVGISVRAIGNRFQERIRSVLLSNLILGLVNIESLNTSSNLLFAILPTNVAGNV
ncbi:MAG: DUF6519 domain-containing protein [Opitutaceae bacterium]|jgi:hypothetical protein